MPRRSRLRFVLALALPCALAVSACGDDPPDESPHGRACTADRDCELLRCVADLAAARDDLAPLELACGGDTTRRADQGGGCEQAEDCSHGVCLLAGACALPCGTDADCSPSERCQSVFARTGPEALQPLRACVAIASLPDWVDGESEIREAALEPESTQLTLAAIEPGDTTLYVIENLEDNWPDGVECRPPLCVRALRTRGVEPVTLFDAAADYVTADPPLNPVAFGDHLHPAVIMLPIGSAGVLSEVVRAGADYSVELAIEQPGDALVTRLSGAAGGRRLDLNVFYAGAADFEPTGDRGPALLADALEVVDEILGQAGIFIGEVRQIPIPGELLQRGLAFPEGDASQGFATLQLRFGVYIELPYLFRLSAGAANPAIDLFFVAEIEPRMADAEPEAESGGIPGPLGMHGTGASGIAISTDMMSGNSAMLGRTLAHEIAHYLGLFHTSEADGRVLEPLADTPECRPARDVTGDGLGVDDCQDFGADNLMFWAKTTGTVLTPQQREILQRALILQ